FAIGCYAPDPATGARCAAGGTCPEGLVCSPASQTCERTAVDAHVDAIRDAAVTAHDAPDAPIDAATTATLIQTATSYASPSTSLAVVLPNAPAAGHVLVLIAGNPHAPLASVTGGGATWTRVALSPTYNNVEIWLGVTDGSSSTVTATDPGSTASMSMLLTEWSGLATANILDGSAAIDGATSPASAGSITTANAHDLLIFAISDDVPNTFGAPAPGSWSALPALDHAVNQAAWYVVVASAGSFAPQVSETAHAWDAALVGLRIAP
ncbi:MAG TPA: hypothetical protein VIV58_21330, partial [Kofleriaceae bacterium]